jgi:hypothetical protein
VSSQINEIVSRNGQALTVEVPLIAIRKAEMYGQADFLGWCWTYRIVK